MKSIVFDQFLDAIDKVDCAVRRLEADRRSAPDSIFAAFSHYSRAQRRAMFAELHRLGYRSFPGLLDAFLQAAVWRAVDAAGRVDDLLWRDRFRTPVRRNSPDSVGSNERVTDGLSCR